MQGRVALEALAVSALIFAAVAGLSVLAVKLAAWLNYASLGAARTWFASHTIDTAFTLGFAAVVVGFFGAWWPLGFIVPGLIVCGVMIWWRARGEAEQVPSKSADEPDGEEVDA